jgi:hypothetical protein
MSHESPADEGEMNAEGQRPRFTRAWSDQGQRWLTAPGPAGRWSNYWGRSTNRRRCPLRSTLRSVGWVIATVR